MRNIFILICSVLLIMLCTPESNAEGKSTFRFFHITEAQGLTSAYTSSLYQDKHGFIWIGSYHSVVYRYDGIHMKAYRNDPADPLSMPAVQYNQMHLDTSNVLWIATSNGLVALDLNTDKNTYYVNDPGDPESFPFGYISDIYEDSPDQLWLANNFNGLIVFNKQTGTFRTYQHDEKDPGSLSSNNVFSLATDTNGTLWIGTAAGADTFDPETGLFSHHRHDPDNPGSLSHDFVFSIIKDKAGTLWFATGKGINALDPGQDVFRRYYFNDSSAEFHLTPYLLYAGPGSGKLWAPIPGVGLYEFNRETEEFIFVSTVDPEDPYSLTTTDINAILEDRSGMLWIGGGGGFLNMAKLMDKGFCYLKNNPQDSEGFHGKVAKDFTEDDSGLIWVAALGGGLQVFDRNSGKIIKRYTHNEQDSGSLLSNEVYSVLLDNEGAIWVGTLNGISCLDRTSGKFTNYYGQATQTMAMLQDSRGDIWAAGWTGLSRFNRELDEFTPFVHDPADPKSIKNSPMFDVYEDSNGNILAGTRGFGILCFNRETEEFSYITHNPGDPGSLSHNGVFGIYEDSRNDLWVATAMGLNRYNRKTGNFIHYSESDGLGSDTVYELLEDDYGNFWIITNVGLTKYDPVKDTFHSYDTSDGILGKDHFGKPFKSRDGFIYFSGAGINYFDPSKITDNQYIPPVVITGMQLFNKDVPIGEFKEYLKKQKPGFNHVEKTRCILTKSITETKELELLYRDYVISFEFAALSFVNTHKNQYAYIMEEFEEEWNYSGTRNFVTYTNLGAGNYTFRVKASNNDGKWNEEGVSLKIKVLPPYWHTWWFRAVISVLALLLLATIFFYFFIKIKAKHKALMIKQEVDIARNIQTSLLPDINQFTDTGYDFEANMSVAESVGGDYYDILRGKDGRLWVGIGDVTGHGISAGLIMVMAQVGIHNLLENISGITPEEMLTEVNKIMTTYIRSKMKSDQHMTINFLVEKAPGHFQYAGAHEIILIHRAKTGKVIQLDTEGFWLGILDDCSKQMKGGRGDFQLEKNDTLLLYTDGLIQIMNKNHEQFDIDRLMDIMRYNCKNPRVLKNAINKAIEEFGGIQKDDITYLICRRN